MDYWKECERAIASAVGGTLVPGSGCGARKGDVMAGNWMIEVKSSEKQFIALQKNWLVKLERESKNYDIALAIVTTTGKAIIIPESTNLNNDCNWRVASHFIPDNEINNIYSTTKFSWRVLSLDEFKQIVKDDIR